MNQKANLNCDILSRSLNSTRNTIHYADYDEYEAFLNETRPFYEIPGAHDGEIILLRKVFIMKQGSPAAVTPEISTIFCFKSVTFSIYIGHFRPHSFDRLENIMKT